MTKLKLYLKLAGLFILLIGAVVIFFFIKSLFDAGSPAVRQAEENKNKLQRRIDEAARWLDENKEMREK